MVENTESINIDVPKRQTASKQEPMQAEMKPAFPTAAPDTVDMSALLPQTASLDQVSAKEYLQLNVFPKLENALNTVSAQSTLALTLIM